MKAKPNAVQPAVVTVSSFKDAAYQSALSNERAESVARWVLTECPTFLDDIPKETKAQLDDGFALRWQENNPAKKYTVDYVPSDTGNIEVTLAFCLSYSQQAFGQMKNEDPVKHGIIKSVRDAFNKYRYNRMRDLRGAVKRIADEGKPKDRTPTKDFAAFMTDTFATVKARCVTAGQRGDASAPDQSKLRMAIDAFYKALSA